MLSWLLDYQVQKLSALCDEVDVADDTEFPAGFLADYSFTDYVASPNFLLHLENHQKLIGKLTIIRLLPQV
jgi:hypothetical protein